MTRPRRTLEPIPLRPNRHGERGVAMLTAIIILALVAGVLTVMISIGLSQVETNKSNAQSMRSIAWLQAATEDIGARMDRMEIGQDIVSDTGEVQIWQAPTGTQNLTITNAITGTVTNGFYRILAPEVGAPEATGLFRYGGTDTANYGTVQFVLEGWTDGGATATRSRTVRVTYRMDSLARYAVLSQQPIEALGMTGAGQIRGSIHSNNVSDAATGINLTGSTSNNAEQISTTRGAISGTCNATRCVANLGRTVDFNAADRAYFTVRRLAQTLGCASGIACDVGAPPASGTNFRAPAWLVNIASGGCVTWQSTEARLRQDTGDVPVIDDALAPVGAGAGGNFCPSEGGGAIAFNGDVFVSGQRAADNAPLTIFAYRQPGFGNVQMTHPTDTAADQVNLSTAASIWINSATVGAAAARNPVGLVAEGGVYVPGARYANGANVSLTNVAMMAKQDEIAVGQRVLSIAADLQGTTANGTGTARRYTYGGGVDPCEARDLAATNPAASSLGVTQGGTLTMTGSILTAREPVFKYGSGACYVGFNQRAISYVPTLAHRPPAFFPSSEGWHVTGWQEYSE